MGCQQLVQERVSLVHRYYDPATEQFLSVDPLVDETGTPWAYTGGDPVNAADPNGLCWTLAKGVAGPCPPAPPGINYNSSCIAGGWNIASGSVRCGGATQFTCSASVPRGKGSNFLNYFYQESAIPGVIRFFGNIPSDVTNASKFVAHNNLGGSLSRARLPLRWNQVYLLGRGALAQAEQALQSLGAWLDQLSESVPAP